MKGHVQHIWKLACVPLALAATVSEARPVWLHLASSDGSKTMVFIDSSSITKNDEVINYWVKYSFKNRMDGIESKVNLEEVNCKTKLYHIIHGITYFVDGTNNSYDGTNQWDYVIPETLGSATFEYACSPHPKKSKRR